MSRSIEQSLYKHTLTRETESIESPKEENIKMIDFIKNTFALFDQKKDPPCLPPTRVYIFGSFVAGDHDSCPPGINGVTRNVV